MRARLITVVALGMTLAFAACGDDAPPRQPDPTAAKAPVAAPAPVGEAAPAEPLAEFVYTPIGKRDPFRAFYEDNVPSELVQAESSCGPLCRWEIDQLRLVAIVSGVASPLAMVEDPEGRGFLVRRGSFIGKRNGKVTDIRRDVLVITELMRNNEQQVIPAKTELRLRSEDEDGAPSGVTDLSADFSSGR